MRYKTEHPAYDNGKAFEHAAEELAQYGFTDQSWHNDACPSLYCPINHDDENYVTLWVDYHKPAMREFEEWSEFAVSVYKDGNQTEYSEYDNLDAALAKAKELAS